MVLGPACMGDGEREDGARSEAHTAPEQTAPAPQRPPVDVQVTADLGAEPRRAASMSGFLHGLAPSPPPADRVRALRPSLWRSIPARAPYARATGFGARYQLVLSDLWGYPPTSWNRHGPPWRDLDGWAALVQRTARAFRGRAMQWDVWNEPDNPDFWNGTREQFLRVYDVAERALVSELGDDVEVGGPSTTKPRPEWLGGLLRHCRTAGCRVSFLSFHANLQPYEPIPLVGRQVRGARRLAGRFGVRRVQVNESVGPADQYRPGEILGYLHHLEGAGADAAARSCWPDLGGSDNCSNATLGGLLTPAGEPRSAWWAYRLYAAGVDRRVPSRSDSPAVVALADAGGTVLLARLDRARDGQSGALEVQLTVTGLGSAVRADVRVDLLPDAGEAPLPDALPASLEAPVTVSSGRATVRVGALRPHEALAVTVIRR